MGRHRRQPKWKNLGRAEVDHFLTGRHRGAKWRGGIWADPQKERAAWDANADDLIRFYGAGRRPWFWWSTLATEPRRVLQTDGMSEPIWTRTWAKGLRRDWDGSRGRFSFGVPIHHPPNIRFETELAYLNRLNLLTPEEQKVKAS
ncbi:hypothetical protein ACFL3S_02530 [Gemmatimonadota bacterium]